MTSCLSSGRAIHRSPLIRFHCELYPESCPHNLCACQQTRGYEILIPVTYASVSLCIWLSEVVHHSVPVHGFSCRRRKTRLLAHYLKKMKIQGKYNIVHILKNLIPSCRQTHSHIRSKMTALFISHLFSVHSVKRIKQIIWRIK